MSEFDYELPEDRIAQEPADPRDSARLLVDRGDGVAPDHAFVRDFDRFVEPGDVIVVNDTRVIAARLNLVKETGGAVEVFLLEPASDGRWSALVRPSRRVPDGSVLTDTTGRCSVVVEEAIDGGQRAVRVELDGRPVIDVESAGVLDGVGEMPLPPYITGYTGDRERYQTVYSNRLGSVAAPTAGLHLTRDVLDRCVEKGASLHTVELVVGLDTFRPVLVDDTDDHEMHTERFAVSEETLDACRSARRVVAIGTTTVRALESAAAGRQDRTDLFIQRGYDWQLVDVLLTNFHMPKSTLLVMIDAFVGPRWRDLYAVALDEGYRFLSFGDAMLLARR